MTVKNHFSNVILILIIRFVCHSRYIAEKNVVHLIRNEADFANDLSTSTSDYQPMAHGLNQAHKTVQSGLRLDNIRKKCDFFISF